ncbi:MAG: hypothetical protein IPM59_15320 [Chloracidobacterium sp.]|nr:hypothetical protein [Chloracidobacterium sp.]
MDLDLPINARDAEPIVALGTDDACAMSAVAVVIHRVRGLVCAIVAMQIVELPQFVIDISGHI